ncbi:glycosyltransferase [Zunongwangia endophytica]|uniref:Glycosyltransferase n=1 Tax=Zunongwangia endophytica TaxID=1808945 RepID=A0ABV8HCM0_9FLAO|nr:glycosyltransferase [Zunongwangia endophytica]MDN3593521.1 glycosyltransferase [Zunongwangia endophytica]
MNTKNKGLNIIGYTNGEFGLGEAVRLNIEAAKSQAIPLHLIDYEKIKKNPERAVEFQYSVNLVQISLRDLDNFFRIIDPELFKFRYTILFLMWESEYLPPEHAENLSLFNEIWTASSFCKNIFKKVYNNPITIVPHPVAFKLNGIGKDSVRSFFDPKKFSFLFVFSYHSSMERKNPMFLLDAFTKAFSKADPVELVIKTVGAASFKKDSSQLIQTAAQHKNVKIYDIDLNKDGINHLINDCDCYVSMHHSEGFGLTLAEAMYLGKPTIATNYSGNTQFMNAENSFLVDYKLGSIQNADKNFCESTVWGHPLLEDAIEKLREAYFDKFSRDHKATSAKSYVENKLSFKNVGQIIKNRLEIIYTLSGDLISNQNAYLLNQLQYTKAENAHLKREIKRMKKNLIIRFVLFLKNQTRLIKNKWSAV